MNLKEAEAYQKRTGKIPVGTVIASPEPIAIGFSFILSGFRFRVKKEISKDEFQKKHMEHLNSKDPAVGNLDVHTKNPVATPVDEKALFPSEDQKYFYEVEVIR